MLNLKINLSLQSGCTDSPSAEHGSSIIRVRRTQPPFDMSAGYPKTACMYLDRRYIVL